MHRQNINTLVLNSVEDAIVAVENLAQCLIVQFRHDPAGRRKSRNLLHRGENAHRAESFKVT